MCISIKRSKLVAEQFLQEWIKKYGKYPVSHMVVLSIYEHVDF